MKVLITGGSGLIGRALTEQLVEQGHEVIILSRSPQKVVGLPVGAQAAAWDGETTLGWGQLINEVDAVVNLAGSSIFGDGLLPQRWTAKRKALIYSSRMKAGKAVLEAISQAENKPKVLVQSSAIGYYGFRSDEIIAEDGDPGSDYLANLSVDWEACTQGVEAHGVRRAVIRTGLVLSSQGGVMPLFRLQFGLFAGGWMGSGKQVYSWIHIDDQVGAIVYLLENENAQGVFNLTAPQPVTNREFSTALGKAMRRPVWLPVPAFVLRLALGEVAALTTNGQRVVPARLQEAGYRFTYPEIKSAFTDLLKKN